MNKIEKSETIGKLKQDLALQGGSVILMDYTGMSVEQAVAVRREFRKAECEYHVIKNTMLKKAVEGTPMEVIVPLLKGATGIAYSVSDPVAPAKTALKCSKDSDKFKIKGGFFEGFLNASGVEDLSRMPSKDELRAMLLATMLAVPQTFMRLLGAAPQQLVLALEARKRQLEEGCAQPGEGGPQ
jgi:large subunit ribosomal protein L10